MRKLSNFATPIIATGNYAQVQANGPIPPPGNGSGPVFPGEFLVSTTIEIIAGTGVSGGVVQPIVMNSDGIWRAYGSPYTLTTPGPVASLSINSPIFGAGISVTTAITGGSVTAETNTVAL